MENPVDKTMNEHTRVLRTVPAVVVLPAGAEPKPDLEPPEPADIGSPNAHTRWLGEWHVTGCSSVAFMVPRRSIAPGDHPFAPQVVDRVYWQRFYQVYEHAPRLDLLDSLTAGAIAKHPSERFMLGLLDDIIEPYVTKLEEVWDRSLRDLDQAPIGWVELEEKLAVYTRQVWQDGARVMVDMPDVRDAFDALSPYNLTVDAWDEGATKEERDMGKVLVEREELERLFRRVNALVDAWRRAPLGGGAP